ncbi:hypothetical protein FG386_001714 [Cryptosporidium ryanae]|uniref:uncharacterized protein n=1 Tax=Cryptosporidium ryanae TaxID=515981 RepID=UPI003519E4D4|nr:hypothetical protein FG386_001714 [Cryptosporidium ryanae]
MTEIDIDIQKLLNSASRYDISFLEKYENCVKDQISKGQYSLVNNLAVLLLYTIHPNRTKLEIVQDILLLSMIRGPISPDFMACTYQIPLPIQNEPSIKEIIQFNELLTNCKFASMWIFLNNNDALKSKVSRIDNFYNSIRDTIIQNIGCSHSCISMNVLSESINFPKDSHEIKEIIEKNNWITDPSWEIVKIPILENPIENTIESNIAKNKPLETNESIIKNYLSVLNSI